MIHPSLTDPAVIAALSSAWKRTHSLRIAPLLEESAAQAVLEALREQPVTLLASPPGSFRYQYWAISYHPDEIEDPTLAALGRWLHGPMAALCSAVTGRSLGPPPGGRVLSTLYTRGCYLDAHNDIDGAREVAYVLGLSPERWPVSEGGHLEFLQADHRAVTACERRPAGWNCLDLFDVTEHAPLHQVSLLLTDRERRVFAGWLHPVVAGL